MTFFLLNFKMKQLSPKNNDVTGLVLAPWLTLTNQNDPLNVKKKKNMLVSKKNYTKVV